MIPTRRLNFDECKEFHKQMTLPAHGNSAKCLLGQPVKLSTDRIVTTPPEGYTAEKKVVQNLSVVRIALGAEVVVNCLEKYLLHHSSVECAHLTEEARVDLAVQEALQDDEAVVAKMLSLARSWNTPLEAEVVCRRGKTDKQSTLEMNSAIDRQLLLPYFPFTASDTSFASENSGRTLASTVSTMLQQQSPGRSRLPGGGEVSIWYDMDALSDAVNTLQTSFTTYLHTAAAQVHTGTTPLPPLQFNHCFAVKAAPLTYLLHFLVQQGLGLETASLMEVCIHFMIDIIEIDLLVLCVMYR